MRTLLTLLIATVAQPALATDIKTLLDRQAVTLVQMIGYNSYPFGPARFLLRDDDFFPRQERQVINAFFDFDEQRAKVNGRGLFPNTIQIVERDNALCTIRKQRQHCFTLTQRGNNLYLVDRGRRAYFIRKRS